MSKVAQLCLLPCTGHPSSRPLLQSVTRTATASVAEGTGSAKTAFTPVVLPSTTPSVSDIGASLMDSLTEPFEGLSLAAVSVGDYDCDGVSVCQRT